MLLRVLWDRGHHANPDEALRDAAVEYAFMLWAWRQRAMKL